MTGGNAGQARAAFWLTVSYSDEVGYTHHQTSAL